MQRSGSSRVPRVTSSPTASHRRRAGFTHTAFTFASESAVTRTHIDPNNVPPGSLVTFIQKGLQYLELEANLDAEVRPFGSRELRGLAH